MTTPAMRTKIDRAVHQTPCDSTTEVPATAALAIRETILPDLIAVDILAQTLRKRLLDDQVASRMLQQMSDAVIVHIEGIRRGLT
jgi:hypothetical protein